MKLLLDTHALLWWGLDTGKLPDKVVAAIADDANQVLVSAVSAFEVALNSGSASCPTLPCSRMPSLR